MTYEHDINKCITLIEHIQKLKMEWCLSHCKKQ